MIANDLGPARLRITWCMRLRYRFTQIAPLRNFAYPQTLYAIDSNKL